MKIICTLFLLFLSANLYAIEITVKTNYKGNPTEGVDVLIYKSEENIYWDKYLFKANTNKEGIARFSIEEGKYYIFAKKHLDNGFFFGFYGLNPVSIKRSQSINIGLVKYKRDFIKRIKEKRLEGFIYFDDKPMEDVGVYIYLDLGSELKGPPFLYAKTDEKGFFSVDIDKGSYYILFRKKLFSDFGPLSSGDFIGVFPEIPLLLDRGGAKIIGNIFKVPEKRELGENKNLYQVKGKVLNKKGEPIDNYYVGLYDNRELVGKPHFVSNPTDKKGSFVIYVKEEGDYYVGVRSKLGDTPEEGEKIFYYGEININKDEGERVLEIILD